MRRPSRRLRPRGWLGRRVGVGVYSRVRELLQRWRRCLAALLFFTLLLGDRMGFAWAHAQEVKGHISGGRGDRSSGGGGSGVSSVATSAASSVTVNRVMVMDDEAEQQSLLLNPWLQANGMAHHADNSLWTLSSPATCTPGPIRCAPGPCAKHGWEEGGADGIQVEEEGSVSSAAAAAAAAAAATSTQCLPVSSTSDEDYDASHNPVVKSSVEICEGDGPARYYGAEQRQEALAEARFAHCDMHSAWSALQAGGSKLAHEATLDVEQCKKNLDLLFTMDALAHRASCAVDHLLDRFDCRQTYSVCYQCHHCKEAYRQWTCAMLMPFSLNGIRLRPCRDFCEEVERQCPYFLPGDRTPTGIPNQYAGEPTFLCRDPNIEETGEQEENSSYGPEDCCYRPCHLTAAANTSTCPLPRCVQSPNGSSATRDHWDQCPSGGSCGAGDRGPLIISSLSSSSSSWAWTTLTAVASLAWVLTAAVVNNNNYNNNNVNHRNKCSCARRRKKRKKRWKSDVLTNFLTLRWWTSRSSDPWCNARSLALS